jgi:hypothetical protein
MWNVFDKPDEQNEARFNSAMARKGGMKYSTSSRPEPRSARMAEFTIFPVISRCVRHIGRGLTPKRNRIQNASSE